MFNDDASFEPVNLQVQRDLNSLVKNDERRHVNRDHTTTIDKDETVTVHGQRTEVVDLDETITIHQNRTEVVDKDETITIHNNRKERVDDNETVDIGGNRTETVHKSEQITIKGNRDKTINGNDSLTVNKDHKETVNKSRSLKVDKNNTELVKMAKSVTVGLAYATQVGTVMNTAVGIMQAEQVGAIKKTLVGKSYTISAGDKFEISVGSSKITMTEDSISITAKTILVGAENKNVLIGKDVLINPPGAVGGAVALAPLANSNVNNTDVPNINNQEKATIGTGLDNKLGTSGVDAFIKEYSPSLANDIESLEKKGWKFQTGTHAKGTFADRELKTITIDPRSLKDISSTVGSIAHEVGHAKYPFVPNYGNEKKYLRAALMDEGAAMVTGIKIRDEIVSNGGPNIGVDGKRAKDYEQIYAKYGDTPIAYDEIGKVYGANEETSNTKELYNKYYGDQFHASGGAGLFQKLGWFQGKK